MSMIRSVATVGGLTLVSRVLGFVRDQLIAFTLGTGLVAQAFIIAQRFPNLFRTLFAEGAFNSAFVPQFARRIEADRLRWNSQSRCSRRCLPGFWRFPQSRWSSCHGSSM
jgi:peptidoglycan biosynthesis protein MviN/MurJ (putative lipid II flippase)